MTSIAHFQAAGAYQDALRIANQIIDRTSSGSAPEASTPARSGSFVDLVSSALGGAMQSGYQSEALSTKAIAGKADLTSVITAVSEAETALNTVVAIRDRVIAAYQDIIKMPV
jgi:flagellar hook-basal body complex protein FliE